MNTGLKGIRRGGTYPGLDDGSFKARKEWSGKGPLVPRNGNRFYRLFKE